MRVGVIAWSFFAAILLTLAIISLTKGNGPLVLYKLHFRINDQVQPGDGFEYFIAIIFAVVLTLIALACLAKASQMVVVHLARWEWTWPIAGLVGGLILGLIQGQVNACYVYFPDEICNPQFY